MNKIFCHYNIFNDYEEIPMLSSNFPDFYNRKFGFGLTISRRLVQALNFNQKNLKLEAKSKPGSGSIFSFLFGTFVRDTGGEVHQGRDGEISDGRNQC